MSGKLINKDAYEFVVVTDLYQENEEGEPILVRANVKSKFTCNLGDIKNVKQILSDKGRPQKLYCSIGTNDGDIVVRDDYFKIQKLIFPETKYIGYRKI